MMNMTQHRKLADAINAEAAKIQAELGQDATWTGQVRVFGQSIWHEFNTPAGVTYYRFPAVGDGPLKSRVAETTAPAVPVYDGKKAWAFVVDSYDGSGYSPDRREWTDAQVLEFVDEHHVVGRSAFLVRDDGRGDYGHQRDYPITD